VVLLVGRVRREMMEWMYGWEIRGAKGSPAELIGNLRESVTFKDLRKAGIMSG